MTRKLTEQDWEIIKAKIKRGVSIKDIAEPYHVTKQHIYLKLREEKNKKGEKFVLYLLLFFIFFFNLIELIGALITNGDWIFISLLNVISAGILIYLYYQI